MPALEVPASEEELLDLIERRTAHWRIQSEVAVIANEVGEPEQALRRSMRLLLERNGWVLAHALLRAHDAPEWLVDAGVWEPDEPEAWKRFREATRPLYYRDDGSEIGHVLTSGRPRLIPDVREFPGYVRAQEAREADLAGAFLFPIRMGDRVGGVVEFFSSEPLSPEPELMETMEHVGIQLGRVLERQDLARRIARSTLGERRRLAWKLHDRFAQELVGLRLITESLTRQDDVSGRELETLVASLTDLSEEMRDLSRGLGTAEVSAERLSDALAELVATLDRRSDTACTFDLEGDRTIWSDEIATELYLIASQALSNAIEHGDPRRLRMTLHLGTETVLEVHDDGRGFDVHAPSALGGGGLDIMKARARAIGGRLTVESRPGAGTRIRCTLRTLTAPAPPPDDDDQSSSSPRSSAR